MCCLYGLIDTKRSLSETRKMKLLHALATAAEIRGTDASGIAYHDAGRLVIRKAAVPGHCLKMSVPGDTITIMGHARMTTQGNEKYNRNNHPFRGKTPVGAFALAHNGVLWNDQELREELNLPRTKIETDSYVAVQLIERKQALDFSSLKYMAEQVEGSFTFTILDAEDSIYIVKGDNPLCLCHFAKMGLYVYASTEGILRTALKAVRLPVRQAKEISIDNGEIVKLDRKGEITRAAFDAGPVYQCEWSYPGHYSGCARAPRSYLDELKDTAAWLGYPPELIDHYQNHGYAMEEIEELLYAGEI